MHRLNVAVAVTGLFIVGCAESANTSGDASTPSQTVTANKPAEEQETPSIAEPSPAEVEGELAPAEADDAAQPSEPQAEDAAERVKQGLKETGDAVAKWSAETKEELVAKAEEHLARIDERIAEVSAEAENLSGDAKARWEETRQDLEQKRQDFVEQVEKLKTSSEDSWDIFAEGLAKAYRDVTEACEASAKDFAKEELE